MEIITLKKHHIKKASKVLASSFYEYPMMRFYFPDPDRRKRYLPWYFGNVLRCALKYGEAYAISDISGVIFTLPPEHTKLSTWEYIKNGFFLTAFVLGFKNFKNSMECEKFVEETQGMLMKNRPHIYLWGLAVSPKEKSKGVGKALLQTVIANADDQKLPVYLETHDEKNVNYYKKYGFKLIHSVNIPKLNLAIWCMLREAH